jgi:acyl carrier protein
MAEEVDRTGTIEERLRRVIRTELGVEDAQIKRESSFTEDLGADSLDATELIMAIEEQFEIEIADDDAEKLTTFGASLDYLAKHVD